MLVVRPGTKSGAKLAPTDHVRPCCAFRLVFRPSIIIPGTFDVLNVQVVVVVAQYGICLICGYWAIGTENGPRPLLRLSAVDLPFCPIAESGGATKDWVMLPRSLRPLTTSHV